MEELNWILPILKTTPRRWTELVESTPLDLLFRQPAQGEWSAIECLLHILDTEQVFTTRLQAFLAGRDFPAFNPDEEGSQAKPDVVPTALAARFDTMRAANLAALAALLPADLERTATHAELGPVSLRQMVNEWAAHDLNHTVQAEQALMQPFIAASGPWKVYFQDHVIESKK